MPTYLCRPSQCLGRGSRRTCGGPPYPSRLTNGLSIALASSSSVRFVNVESSNRVLVRVGLSASVSESMCASLCARFRVRESMCASPCVRVRVCVCARGGLCLCDSIRVSLSVSQSVVSELISFNHLVSQSLCFSLWVCEPRACACAFVCLSGVEDEYSVGMQAGRQAGRCPQLSMVCVACVFGVRGMASC